MKETKTTFTYASHKLGPNQRELARRVRRLDPNFAQSRDIREDRGERQIKQIPARHHSRQSPAAGKE